MVKNLSASAGVAGDTGSVPGSGRSTATSPHQPPEWETSAHSDVLAWEIPWMEEPGGVESLGLQHDWSTQSMH